MRMMRVVGVMRSVRMMRVGMRAVGAIIRALGRLVQYTPDCPGAAPTLRVAAEAAIDLTGYARRIRAHGGSDLMVGQDVAGADDHCRGDASPLCHHSFAKGNSD